MAILQFFIAATLAFATTTAVKTHKDEKYKYLLSAPENWTEQEIRDKTSPVKLNLWGEDKKASMILMVSVSDAKSSATDFMKSMESSRKLKNTLKPDQAKISKELLKKWNVSEAVRSQYELTGKGPNFPVVQKTLVLKKGKLIYSLIVAYPKSEQGKFQKPFEDLEKSFRALE